MKSHLSRRLIQVLSLSADSLDHTIVEAGLQCWVEDSATRCMLFKSANLAEAIDVLAANNIAIVICRSSSLTWRDLLSRTQRMPVPPSLILVCQVANDHFCAEARTLGAYAVLAKPLEENSFSRTLMGAWLHWRNLADQGGKKLDPQPSNAHGIEKGAAAGR